MPKSLDNSVKEEWKKQKKGIFNIPEKLKDITQKRFFKEWEERIKDKKIEIFEFFEYTIRGEEIKQALLKRHIVENLIKTDIIRNKKKPQKNIKSELCPLSIAQIISYVKKIPIEQILKKESMYFKKLEKSLTEKIIKEKRIKINSKYTIKESSIITGLHENTLKERVRKELIYEKEKPKIKGIDLILANYKHKNKNYFTKQEVKKLFNKEVIDFEKLGFFSEKNYCKNKILRIYKNISSKLREELQGIKYYEMELFKTNEKYEIPEEIKESQNLSKNPQKIFSDFNTENIKLTFNGKKYVLGSNLKEKIIENSAKFSEDKKRKKWDENLKKYFLINIMNILPEKKEYDCEIYIAFNTKTGQLWKIDIINDRLIIDFEIKEYK
jgi:hypothetical protein